MSKQFFANLYLLNIYICIYIMSTSGPEDCLCSFEAPCVLDLDLIVDILDPVYTELDCQNLCRLESDCSYYSWFDSNGTLFEEVHPAVVL